MNKPSPAVFLGIITIPLWVVVFPLAGFAQTQMFPHRDLLMIVLGGAFFVTLGLNIAGVVLSLEAKGWLAGLLLNGVQAGLVLLVVVTGAVLNWIA